MAVIHIKEQRRRSISSLATVIALDQERLDRFLASAGNRRQQKKQLQTAPATPKTQNHYRRAADSFAEDADGVVHAWNGIDQPARFEATVGSYETDGVIAPATAPGIGGSGTGPIVGTYYAYVRFTDRDGNLSSLSPVSAAYIAQSSLGSITGATNASPIVITGSGLGSLGAGQTVKISNVAGNTAANGIYSVLPLTSSTAALYQDTSLTTPVIGNGTYLSGGTIITGVATIVYSNVPIPTEARVVSRQILRNQDGDLNTFYVDIDTTDLTSTTFFSQTPSSDLLDAVPLSDTSGKTLVDKSVPPTYKKVICFQGGRLFAAGNETYSEGCVSLTSGSNVVTGIGTEWGPVTFGGRYFEVLGGTKRYTIDHCNSTTQLVLTEPYAGTTDPFAYYNINVGDGERRTMYWSEPAQPEAWPLINTLTLAEDPNAGEITAMMAKDSWLYIITENRIYRFSWVSEPLTDGFVVKAAQRGCVNNRCWVQVEDNALMMDSLGIHSFAGNDDEDIGTPAVQDLFRQRPTAKYRINWNAKRYFHAVYNPGEATVRWFVSLDHNELPHHAICYHVRLKRWWLEEYPWPIMSSCLGRLNGRPQIYLGTTGKRIMAYGAGQLDGPNGSLGTIRGTVTSSGVDWIADSTASFATSGIVGNSISIVRGRGKGQHRLVYSVSGTRITVSDAWTTLPDTSSVYQIGGITWVWQSGWMRWADEPYENVRALSLHFRPTTAVQELYLRAYHDLSSTAQDWQADVLLDDQNGIGHLANDPSTDLSVSSTKTNGYVTTRLDAFRQMYTDAYRYVSFQINGVSGNEQLLVYRLTIDGAKGT